MEFDLSVYICPKCRKEMSRLSKYCSVCGARIIKLDLIINMEADKVTRVIFAGQS